MNTITNPFVTPADAGVVMLVCVSVFVLICVAYVVARTVYARTAVERSIRAHRVSEAHKAADEEIAAYRLAAKEAREAAEANKPAKAARPVTRRGFKFNIHVEFK